MGPPKYAGIVGTDRVTNTEILLRMKKIKEVLMTEKIRKLQYLGHVMRNKSGYYLLQFLIQGKIPGKQNWCC